MCNTRALEQLTSADLCNPFPLDSSVCRNAENKDTCRAKFHLLFCKLLCVHVHACDSESKARDKELIWQCNVILHLTLSVPFLNIFRN